MAASQYGYEMGTVGIPILHGKIKGISAPGPMIDGKAPGFRPLSFVFRPRELHHLVKLPPQRD